MNGTKILNDSEQPPNDVATRHRMPDEPSGGAGWLHRMFSIVRHIGGAGACVGGGEDMLWLKSSGLTWVYRRTDGARNFKSDLREAGGSDSIRLCKAGISLDIWGPRKVGERPVVTAKAGKYENRVDLVRA
ncbi:hypothetical protein B0H19DRAFT_1061824 [Mycena capillaripes]|nr:hypothetical protein B0H19DRAFT_1061824 [Mycena capillaripes]